MEDKDRCLAFQEIDAGSFAGQLAPPRLGRPGVPDALAPGRQGGCGSSEVDSGLPGSPGSVSSTEV
jgi:hypothetical protein